MNKPDNNLPWFSASKVKVFQQCKKQYIAKYIEKLPKPITSYGTVGLAVHEAIQKAYSDEFPYEVARKRIKTEFELLGSSFIGWGEQEALSKAYAMLDNVPYDDYDPLAMELEFILPFPQNNPICNLHGFVDMVTTDYRVVDWKTSNTYISKKDSATQLAIYYYAVKQLYGIEPSDVHIYQLPKQRKIQLEKTILLLTLKDLEIIIQDMINLESTKLNRCEKCSIFCPLYLQGLQHGE